MHHGEVTVSMRKVRERKQRIVEEFRASGLKGIKSTKNLDLLMGDAKFIAAHEIEVQLNEGGSRKLTADKIFINTGGRPARPLLEGINDVPTLDSTSIMELDELPEHLLVLGGGYIGLEFGQMFRRFGSRVTIIQRTGQLLGREDQDVAEAVLGVMKEDGIDVLLNTEAVRVQQNGKQINLNVGTNEGAQTQWNTSAPRGRSQTKY